MDAKPYFISVKRGKENQVESDWQDRLREMAGVTLQGATRRRAYVLVEDQAIERVRDEFGETCHIEAEARRSPL